MDYASRQDIPQDDTARRGDIAIVGMSCVFPGAPDLRTFWRNVVSKVDSVGDPPEGWGAEVFYDEGSDANDRIYCKRGGYLKELAEFDPLRYGVMPSSLAGAESGHFLALRAAYDALEDAGYAGREIDGRGVEVILGKGSQFGHADLNAIQHGVVVDQTLRILKRLHPEHTDEELAAVKRELKSGLLPFNAETVPGLVSNVLTGRISNRLDLMGANYTVDAACASSVVALERGVRDLRDGRCGMAIVGGIEPSMPPLIVMIFCQIEALSRAGKIRPFDKDAAGTLLGEGVGVVVLKRREDAERDGDRVYALVRGVGVSSDGRGAGLLAPRLEGEALAIERAYTEAGINPRTVGLVEAHGTGVALGDVTEIRALTEVFGPREGAHPTCAVGSVKSMVSHLVHAAGVAGVIKAALALYHKVLPPTLCDEANPELELEKTPFYINTETRPWIHGGAEPRRAGVSSFGFGGVNSHAVLEEHRAVGEEVAGALSDIWETELFVVQSDTREGLVGECRRLQDFLSSREGVVLKDLAYTLNCGAREGGFRLGVVASGAEDLSKKLALAVKKLSDPRCNSIRDRGGVFFFDRPLGREGKLAFMFPGYGSEYVDMLSDLCVNFPEVRAHFDRLDDVTRRGARSPLPSQVFFPPPLGRTTGADPAQEKVFSETAFITSAMCTADLAMSELFERLEIRPSAVVGHSNGEFAALLAGGAVRIADDERFVEYALSAQSVYDSFASEIPTAKVLAVGGGDPAAVEAVIRASRGALLLTIDNCPHQAVLCGPEEAINEAANFLRARGAVCNMMPFDHAVHSPLFQPICDRIAAAHENLEIKAPEITVYSCTTARPHSRDAEEIRRLIMNHLALPVRFRQTIEAMHDDGVRVFLEVGPKGSLTSFVNDTLGDRDFVAVPANTTNRSGIAQLNFALALLAAHHVPMRLDYLYARRAPRLLSLDSAPEAAAKSRALKLSLDYNLLDIKGDALSRATAPRAARAVAAGSTNGDGQSADARDGHNGKGDGRKLHAHAGNAYSGNGNGANGQNGNGHAVHVYGGYGDNGNGHGGNGRNGHNGNGRGVGAYEARPTAASNGRATRAAAVGEYLRTMGRFLDTQSAVVEAFIAKGASKSARARRDAEPAPTPAQPPALSIPSARPAAFGPFNMTLRRVVAGRELEAVCLLDLDEHLYLRDHTIGRAPSVIDETLLAMAVVPLTFSMELMAQAASPLAPGKRLVGMKNFRSHRWIEVGEQGRSLSLSAKVKDDDPRAVEVKIVGASEASGAGAQTVLAEGVMLFGDDYAPSPAASDFECDASRPYHLSPGQYYDAMFHGPCFRTVASVEAFDASGARATLKSPRGARLFRSCDSPELLTDPVLLDGTGQLIGFWTWTLEGFESSAATFPVGFEALDLYRPFARGGETLRCDARISLSADGRTLCDINLVGADGRPVARLKGWEHMRSLGWAHKFNRFIVSPREVVYTEPWVAPATHFDAPHAAECRVVSDGPGGLWPHVLAGVILSRRERETFSRLAKPERVRRNWLLGRLAAKDAVRVLIQKRLGISLCPADVEIVSDEHGRPRVALDLEERLGGELFVSISHSAGRAAAVACVAGGARGLGIDIERADRASEALEQVALTAAERKLLSSLAAGEKQEWLLRVWCAKEAVAKALGRGMAGSPLNLSAVELKVGAGEVLLTVSGELASHLPETAGRIYAARTGRHDDLVYATALA